MDRGSGTWCGDRTFRLCRYYPVGNSDDSVGRSNIPRGNSAGSSRTWHARQRRRRIQFSLWTGHWRIDRHGQ
jgi:hypothetical protein